MKTKIILVMLIILLLAFIGLIDFAPSFSENYNIKSFLQYFAMLIGLGIISVFINCIYESTLGKYINSDKTTDPLPKRLIKVFLIVIFVLTIITLILMCFG